MRRSRSSVLSVLFLYLFVLSAPVHGAYAHHETGACEDGNWDEECEASEDDHESDDYYYDDDEDYDDDDEDCDEYDEDGDCADGWSTEEWIGSVLGGVAGVMIGLPIGPVGLIGGGLVGVLLGKWIGDKLDEKSLGDRASDSWDDVEERWDSDGFPGKYWWKDTFSWDDEDDDWDDDEDGDDEDDWDD